MTYCEDEITFNYQDVQRRVRINAASPSSLGSDDCAEIVSKELQRSIPFTESYFCGMPTTAPTKPPMCGEAIKLIFNGRESKCIVAWTAEDPIPGDWAYVEIFKKPYEELTGESIINDIYFETGWFEGFCVGTCLGS